MCVASQWNPRRSRGASRHRLWFRNALRVSVEPPPKQGCEISSSFLTLIMSGLSGTPAEAGVRAFYVGFLVKRRSVSVEPPPKQGCEEREPNTESNLRSCLSGTPAEAGVRVHGLRMKLKSAVSQWNPRRSRGASASPEHIDIACRIGAFIHPPAILFDFCDFKEHLCDFTSNSYCLSSGSTSIHPPIRFFVAHRVFHSARKFLLATFAG